MGSGIIAETERSADLHFVVRPRHAVGRAFGEDERSARERGRLLMKQAPGVDDDRLAGHGLGATHSDHHVGAIVLVGCLLQERS